MEAVRVQILSQAGISEVPSQYVQPPENRPTPITNSIISLSCNNVPAIDLSQDKESIIEAIQEACREWGAFHVINHGVPTKLMDDLKRIITNGKYKSCVHRAITNASKPRLSLATFHDPAKAVRISPADDLVSPSSPPRYSPVVYGDYMSSWYKGPEGKRNLDALLIDAGN
ncbi:Oxoglutarate/iron-dependent dioxygenase [Corchorus capsularis]|uniref:Oxoglutarate/iron-dependent dioxygenase n=1 Tax=Corchorus capsularis TaxID=210143 RepID=A0A1R3HX98_COCAP|nr:Oxoglutarate/iron-dependent dioxygenase [Corchorus capsularis]